MEQKIICSNFCQSDNGKVMNLHHLSYFLKYDQNIMMEKCKSEENKKEEELRQRILTK